MKISGGIRDYFGLDIGTNEVRVVQLSSGGSSYSLKAFASAPIPPGLAQSDSVLDMQKIGTIIKELTKQAGIGSKNVISAIPGTSTYSTLIKLPPMSQTELEKAIKYQAEQNLPVKIDEVKYDYQIITEDPQSKELTVMVIAATKNKIKKQLEMLESADLNVIALETSAVAMARSLAQPEVPLAIILDVGATTTEIAVVDNGSLTQTRSFPLAGIAMTRSVSQQLGLDLAQSEQFKVRFGLSQDKLEGRVYKAIVPILNDILEETTRSANYYEEQFGKKLTRVILTGGSSRIALLPEFIRSSTNLEVMYGNPWRNVSYSSNVSNSIMSKAPEFATAIGLAMRG